MNSRLVSYKQIQEAKHLLQNEGYIVKRKIKENKSKVPTTIEFLNIYEDPQNYQNNREAYDLVHKMMDNYGTFEEDVAVIYRRMSDDDKIKVCELLRGKKIV